MRSTRLITLLLVAAVGVTAACDRFTAPTAPALPARTHSLTAHPTTQVAYYDFILSDVAETPECLPPWTTCRPLTNDEVGNIDQLYYELWDTGCYTAAMSLYQQAHTGKIVVGTSEQHIYGARTLGDLFVVGNDTTLSDVFTVIDYTAMDSWVEMGKHNATHEMIHADHFFDGDFRGADDLGEDEELQTQDQTAACYQ